MIMPFLALALLVALPASLIWGEVYTFRGRRIRFWKDYAFHFPDNATQATSLKAGPLIADLGRLSLKHIWYHVRMEGISFLLPWRSAWLIAELGQEGLRLRNAPSMFGAVNQLPPLWIPSSQVLWATAHPGSWFSATELSLDLKGGFEPGKDPTFSLPLQINLRLHFDSTQQARTWAAELEVMGIQVMGRGGLTP